MCFQEQRWETRPKLSYWRYGIIVASRTGSLGATSTRKRSPSALQLVYRNRGMMREMPHWEATRPTTPKLDKPSQTTHDLHSCDFRSQPACSQRYYFSERSQQESCSPSALILSSPTLRTALDYITQIYQAAERQTPGTSTKLDLIQIKNNVQLLVMITH